jgi:hypothetical protein
MKKGQQMRQFFQGRKEGGRVSMNRGSEQEMIQVRAGYGFEQQAQGPLGPAP